jgi:hypothetical protein
MSSKPKNPAGPPMTLGNMRELGVQRFGRVLPERRVPSRRADRRVELSGRHRRAVVPFSSRVREVRQPREQDRRSPELERATDAAEPHRQGVAVRMIYQIKSILAAVLWLILAWHGRHPYLNTPLAILDRAFMLQTRFGAGAAFRAALSAFSQLAVTRMPLCRAFALALVS